jgi:hypothetical protein
MFKKRTRRRCVAPERGPGVDPVGGVYHKNLDNTKDRYVHSFHSTVEPWTYHLRSVNIMSK